MIYRKFTIITAWIFLISGSCVAQSFKLSNEKSNMQVEGTSTLHDWHSVVEKITGSADFVLEDQMLVEINNLSISVPVKSIKSGKGGMDNKTYEALKEKEHPDIHFSIAGIVDNAGKNITTKGDLTIAGETRNINLDVTYHVVSESTIEFEGEIFLKMTDYDMTPPKALLGTVKAGDEVTIKFKVVFYK